MLKIPSHSSQWVLARHPTKNEKLNLNKTFKLEHNAIPTTSTDSKKILVKAKYLSNAPGLRVLIEETPPDREFAPTTKPGDIVRLSSIVEVVVSSRPDFKQGDLLYTRLGRVDFMWIDPDDPTILARHLPTSSSPTDLFSLEVESLTAYFGLLKVGKATPATRTIIISAAAGATGSTVCQIAKNVLGVEKVIGITRGAEKCNILTTQCGCDIALNYKDLDFAENLKSATPEYIDLFFDNVGGFVLDSVLQRMGKDGRVVSCGSVSSYDGENKAAVSVGSWSLVTKLRLNIQGFIFFDHFEEFGHAASELKRWMDEGKLKILKTEYKCKFEDVPHGLEMLLKGENIGSLVTEILD